MPKDVEPEEQKEAIDHAVDAGSRWPPFGHKAFAWTVAAIIIGSIAATLLTSLLTDVSPWTLFRESTTASDESESESERADELASIGETVSDGRGFAWTLASIECGLSTSDLSDPNRRMEEARGDICKAEAEVTNRSDDAQSPFSSPSHYYLYIRDSEYRAFTTRGDGFGQNLFPDASDTASIYFDVPPGSKPTELHLHRTAISEGALFRIAD